MIRRLSLQAITLLSIWLLGALPAHCQLEQFQKEYLTKAFTHCYDIASTLDGGYIYSGIQDNPAGPPGNGTSYVTRLDCNGDPVWTKRFAAVSGLNNTDHEVEVISEDEFILMTSRGFTGNFDILLVKMDDNGNTLWAQTYGGVAEDIQGGITVLSDGNLAVVGLTNSYGGNANSFWRDIYALKIDASNGNVIWSTTLGFPGAISRAYDVVENDVGGIALTGTVFHAPTVANYAPLIQLDSMGNLISARFFGMPDRNTGALGLSRSSDGGYLLSGSTNILGLDWFDNRKFPFVLKTDAAGDLVWGRVLEGSPNQSGLGGIAYSPVDNGDTIAVACETYFYQNQTVDPTKRLLFLLNSNDGNLINARQYNLEGGQFPIIKADFDGGYIMSAFTDENNGSGPNDQWWSGPIINKLDQNFDCGCNETDRTTVTTAHSPSWVVNDTINFPSISTGAQTSALPVQADSFAMQLPVVSTFCETKKEVDATLTVPDPGCLLQLDLSTHIDYPAYTLTWDLGDGTTISNPAPDSINHTFPGPGNYPITLTVEICDTSFMLIDTVIISTSGSQASIDPIGPLCESGGQVTLTAIPVGGTWTGVGISDGQAGTFDPQLTGGVGTYSIAYSSGGACPALDTIQIEIISDPTIDPGPDLQLPPGASTSLNAGGGFSTYSWSPMTGLSCSDCPDPVANPAATTTYTVLVTDQFGCSASGQLTVEIIEEEPIFIPNVFSPNSDGRNDVFKITSSAIPQFQLTVLNRWGDVVFESDNLHEGWDGTSKGELVPAGVYFYVLDITRHSGENQSFSGNVTLLR